MEIFMKNVYYAKDISWTLLDNEVFVFNEKTDKIYVLRGMAKDFWMLISQYNDIEHIIETLSEKYPEKKTNLIKKVMQYVGDGLIIGGDDDETEIDI